MRASGDKAIGVSAVLLSSLSSLLYGTACNAPPLSSPVPVESGGKRYSFPQNLKDKADILFMVDNSNSMDAMQAELKNRFSQFFLPFEEMASAGKAVDLHIGVVTSDYGAGNTTNVPGCGRSPGGQMGKLQAIGARASQGCKKPLGANFIQYAFNKTGAAEVNNLPQGQDLLATFTCMASVGSQGCGFEHQLESVYAALHDNIPENQGFLRDDALLVIVFLTNEDDSSAPPDTDLFDPNRSDVYGFEDSYSRQTRFAIICGDKGEAPPYGSSNGELRDCRPAPNSPAGAGPGKQFDVQRYMDFFNNVPMRGGIKSNPQDVVLVGIDAPEAPFEVILSDPTTKAGKPYVQCAQYNEKAPCVPVLQHSCMNANQTGFFGDPAIRLNTVIRSAPHHAISSICDDDYSSALSGAAQLIVSTLGGNCVTDRLPKDPADPTKLSIDCNVDDVTLDVDGTTTTHAIPQCPDNGANPGATPCWRIEPKALCTKASPNGVGLTVDRAGQAAPLNTTAFVTCAIAG